MATIEIVVRDDLGNVINDVKKRTYQLELEDESFDSIEKATTEFKNQALPDIQADLLTKCQSNFIEKKEENLKCNGTMPVIIKTLHGQFRFKLQRFIEGNENQITYFNLTHQFMEGYVSNRLKEFSAFYSNRLSYKEVEDLVEKTAGQKQLSDQTVRSIVVDKAVELSKDIESRALAVLEDDSLKFPVINQKVDIYDINTKEVLLFEDGIQVKGQKDIREKCPKNEDGNGEKIPKINNQEKCSKTENEDRNGEKTPKVNNNVVLFSIQTGEFEYIITPIDETGEESMLLSDLVKSKIIEEYGDVDTPLNMVAITDGAKDIRATFFAIFGIIVTIILDWYHLGKKLREHMSMIARNKEEKTEHLKFLFSHLWHGQTDEALEYLKTKVKPKNGQKLQELITYLEKHKTEIIDYDRRKKTGKNIGRGLLKEDAEESEKVALNSPSEKENSSVVESLPVVENLPVTQKQSIHHQKAQFVLGSGRVEKACDTVIGNRQKNKGMSWGKKGSRSLGILKIEELNNKWEKLWFPKLDTANNSQPTAANDSFVDSIHSLPRAA